MSQTVTLGQLFNEYKENEELTLLDPGDYDLEVLSVKVRDTDIIPTYRVAAGPYLGKRILAGVISWKGNATGRFFSTMAKFGLGEDFFRANPSPEDMKRALEGRVINATILQEPPNKYHEDTRNKLEKVNTLVSAPAGSGSAAGVPAIPQPAGIPAPAVPPAAAPPAAVAPPAAPLPPAVASAPVAPVEAAPAASPAAVPPIPAVPAVPAVPAPVAAVPPVPAPVAAPLPGAVAAAPQPGAVAPAPPAPAVVPIVPAETPVAAAPVAGTIPVDDEPGF